MNGYYLGWQLRMDELEKSISDALNSYYKRFGYPPQILLVSRKLEEVPVPKNLNLVIRTQRVPKNILMLGTGDDEQDHN